MIDINTLYEVKNNNRIVGVDTLIPILESTCSVTRLSSREIIIKTDNDISSILNPAVEKWNDIDIPATIQFTILSLLENNYVIRL